VLVCEKKENVKGFVEKKTFFVNEKNWINAQRLILMSKNVKKWIHRMSSIIYSVPIWKKVLDLPKDRIESPKMEK